MVARPPEISRRAAIISGWSGDAETARSFFASTDTDVRASAFAALVRMEAVTRAELAAALTDPAAQVRRRALMALPSLWSSDLSAQVDLLDLLHDSDPVVLEVACFTAGECPIADQSVIDDLGRDVVSIEQRGEAVATRLAEIARDHPDPLCRESAVAALGSLGDPIGADAVLSACGDKATIRRRAVLALAAFDGPEIDAMLTAMSTDVDWQVRQAAEELLAIGAGQSPGPDLDE